MNDDGLVSSNNNAATSSNDVSSNGTTYYLLLPTLKPVVSHSTNTPLLLQAISKQSAKASVNGANPIDVKSLSEQLSLSRNAMTTHPKPKMKRIVCDNCGIKTTCTNICNYCRKPVSKHLQVDTVSNANSSSSRNINAQQVKLNKSSCFYGKRGLGDFTKYLDLPRKSLRAQRARKIPSRASDCITISDSSDDDGNDDDDDDDDDCKLEILSVTSAKEPSREGRPLFECNKRSTDDVPVKVQHVNELVPRKVSIRNTLVSKRGSLTQRITNKASDGLLHVKFTSIRIGQMNCLPKSPLQISNSHLSATLTDHILNLKWFSVKLLELSSLSCKPCLYITLNGDCVPSLRCNFQMTPGKTPYFNPDGEADERYIIVFIDEVWFQDAEDKLRHRLRSLCVELNLSQNFFKEITAADSISRLSSMEGNSASDKPASKTRNSLSSPSKSITSPGNNHTSSTSDVTSSGYVLRTRSQQTGAGTSDVEDLKPCFSGKRIELAIYPPPPTTGGISISNADVFCLNEGEFLNDVIIDFYLKYIMNEIVSEHDKNRSHVFSSFFYSRLSNIPKGRKGHEDKEQSPAQRRHARVRNWTRGVDIFSKDFVFVPVNDASHWFLAVICFPGKILETEPTLVISDVRSLGGASESLNKSDDSYSHSLDDTLPEKMEMSSDSDTKIISSQSAIESPSKKDLTESELCVRVTDNNPNTDQDVVMFEDDETDPTSTESTRLSCVKNNSATRNAVEVQSPNIMLSDELPTSGHERPCILIFDSLRATRSNRTASVLRDYLKEEWKSRKSSAVAFDRFNIKVCSPSVPQQDNYSDCGLFLLHYAEKIFECPIKDYTLPIKSLKTWFDPEEVKSKRKDIKDVIEKLRVSQTS